MQRIVPSCLVCIGICITVTMPKKRAASLQEELRSNKNILEVFCEVLSERCPPTHTLKQRRKGRACLSAQTQGLTHKAHVTDEGIPCGVCVCRTKRRICAEATSPKLDLIHAPQHDVNIQRGRYLNGFLWLARQSNST